MRSEVIPADMRRRLLGLHEELTGLPDERPHDAYARIAVGQAIEGGLEGNAAVGALLVDPAGEVMLADRNRMLAPRFRSDCTPRWRC